jgi:hypothetical protein
MSEFIAVITGFIAPITAAIAAIYAAIAIWRFNRMATECLGSSCNSSHTKAAACLDASHRCSMTAIVTKDFPILVNSSKYGANSDSLVITDEPPNVVFCGGLAR